MKSIKSSFLSVDLHCFFNRSLKKRQNIMRLVIKIGVAGNVASISFACAFLGV